jgi:hypothetical protein
MPILIPEVMRHWLKSDGDVFVLDPESIYLEHTQKIPNI